MDQITVILVDWIGSKVGSSEVETKVEVIALTG